ncbi:hypothetical protein [Micrococcus luteus]|uniref:hypothetical protein n=1 Tax=Micrococcus luteus TaxID=1270 RepID=UPI00332D5A36
MSERITVDRRLYLVEDGSRVVGEGDPDARWLYCVPGQPILRAEAERFGLLGEPPEGDEEPEEAREASSPASKARRRPADKAQSRTDDK